MEITNPKRVLILGTPDAGIDRFLKELTGTVPNPINGSLAGVTHPWTLKTAYYTVKLSLWIDELTSLEPWRAEFSKPEAAEIVQALGAWIYVFPKPVTAADLEAVKDTMRAIEAVTGEGWDGTCIAVGTAQSTTTDLKLEGEAWDGLCGEVRFEYIDAEGKGRNEFGEKVGMERVREVLETTEWERDDDLGAVDGYDDFEGLDDFGEFGDEEVDALAEDRAELSMELLGLKRELHSAGAGAGTYDEGDEEEQVEELNRMMGKFMAIKDTTAGMPEAEKKRFAAKAMRDLMREADV